MRKAGVSRLQDGEVVLELDPLYRPRPHRAKVIVTTSAPMAEPEESDGRTADPMMDGVKAAAERLNESLSD